MSPRTILLVLGIVIVIMFGMVSTMKKSVQSNEAREAKVLGEKPKAPPAPASKP